MELRTGYKQTEVGVIPEDWDCVHIGDIAETSSGATPSRSNQHEYFDGGTIPWVKTLDLNNSLILETDECITPNALQQTSLRLYPSGSVLVAMYGGFNQIGRTGMLAKDATINQALTAIRPDKSRLSSNFLLNYLNFGVEYWKSVASSSRKDPNITGKDVRAFPIALPPLKEQEAAGKALQDIENQIFMLDGLINKKTDIKHAAMQELLTGKRRLPGFEGEWVVKRLEELCSMKSGEGITAKSIDAIAPFPCFGGNGQRGFTSRFTHEGDYCLIGRVGALCGNLLKVSGKFFASEHAIVVSTFENVDVTWLTLALGLLNLNRRAESSAQPVLTVSKLLPLELRIPQTKEEQASIAAVISDMASELASIEARLGKARELKKGMMQQLLTGKIRLK